ncbi:MAG: hypothetical protein JO340_18430 [Acidobacteriaceae bacterium]|nr:hypothetical protein [Acidobacteriaceae bacterium]
MAFRAASLILTLCAIVCSAGARPWAEHSDSASTAAPAPATPAPNPGAGAGDFLERVRSANEQLYSDLESFVCREEMTRYKGSLSGDKARQIDTVTARVSFENGTERYTEVRQNRQPRTTIAAVPGAWSEGEFGTLLRQTQLLLKTQPVRYLGDSHVNDTPAAVYAFEVNEEDSPWDLAVGGQHYRIPFRTEVSVARDSGQILEIERTSVDVPPQTRISEVRWSVSLAPVDLNGRTWLLPRSGEYAVRYDEAGRREWNLLSFADYHRYGSEVALRFDDVK